MQKTFFKKQNKVFIMFRLIIFMIIVFNTHPSAIAQVQDSKLETMKAQMDSLKTAHLERAAQMKKEILERHQALNESMEKSNIANVVIINGKVYSAKESLEIKLQPGMEVQVRGESNSIIINSKGDRNIVIVSQSGEGNKASINNKTPKQSNNENENFM